MFPRDSPKFFYQVGHQTTYALVENKHFFTKSCHCQIYQDYEQQWVNINWAFFLENKVSILKIKVLSKFSKTFICKNCSPSLIFSSEKNPVIKLMLKNCFESQNFAIFDKVVHNLGFSEEMCISTRCILTLFNVQLDTKFRARHCSQYIVCNTTI